MDDAKEKSFNIKQLQQSKIEQITKELCFSSIDYIGMEEEEKNKRIESILSKLYDVFPPIHLLDLITFLFLICWITEIGMI